MNFLSLDEARVELARRWQDGELRKRIEAELGAKWRIGGEHRNTPVIPVFTISTELFDPAKLLTNVSKRDKNQSLLENL